ncbi:MAG TPA: tRNA 4-thiouridine(8) synthase ThiI [Clostridiales bacterium]|nr:tRNA 4-thiouridine(8) synthase ThiI [Clostridiales bacterium]
MLYKAFLIKYAEIGLKGKNRYMFENALINRTKVGLEPVGRFNVIKEQGRLFVQCLGEYDFDEAIAALNKVFGIAYICPVVVANDNSWDVITKEVGDYIDLKYPTKDFTFKVEAKRADKRYPLNSPQMCSAMGSYLLDRFPELKVDVHKPQKRITIEIRTQTYFYTDSIKGPGGMPVGSNGKAMLLLSGGIDSPVAGYMIAKRGVSISATYFHAPPYTSERAKQKVVDLAKKISKYTGSIKLNVVNFTDIQLYIYDQCPHEELTIIMRRYMMKIAEKIAIEEGCLGLITGESIGQVASQTIQSLAATNEVCSLPVFRPLIAFDKQDIINISDNIDTYETSIQPFEDCCTIFVAKHPVTKPNIKAIIRSEKKLEEKIEGLVNEALETIEVINID